MRYLNPYHIATYVLIIFSFGHTVGGLLSEHSYGPAGDAVFASMKSVHFDFHGGDCTFYGLHMGFGLMATVFLLFSASATWILAESKPADRAALRPIAWALFLAYVPTVVLSWVYFFAGPGVFSTAIALLMGWECFTTYWDNATGRTKDGVHTE
jgi:hypothetical protein